VKDAVPQIHVRHPVDRRADGRPPGEGDLLARERRAPEQGRHRRRHEVLDGYHDHPSILALPALRIPHRIVLASASPRRAELLSAAGVAFDVDPADVDESIRDGESPPAYVQRVAADKARAVHIRRPNDIVVAADTTVVVDGQILGKPADGDDARRMLRLLSGRAHQVMTGVAVAAGVRLDARIDVTTVGFSVLGEDEIDWYVASGEPLDKAGAYGIQGLASRFVTRIEGSYSNVVGLPVALVYEMLKALHPPG
jgi:septum formation protein